MAWPEGQGRLPDAALKGGAFPTPQKACAAAMGHPHGLGSGNMHESIGPSWADGLGRVPDLPLQTQPQTHQADDARSNGQPSLSLPCPARPAPACTCGPLGSPQGASIS